MRNFSLPAVLAAALTVPATWAAPSGDKAAPLNVLFIAVDDLRPNLGCYGDPVAKSPNIDRLAAQGTVFSQAYCQQALCNPSRSSVLTGQRPETLDIFDLRTNIRDRKPEIVTLPQYFKQEGYYTESIGKIFHVGHSNHDDPASWTVSSRHSLDDDFEAKGKVPWAAPDVADTDLKDGLIAEAAVKTLQEIKDKPFFLAVGFLKPHLPFIAPKKYWDLYERDQFSLAANPSPPKGAPKVALHSFEEFRKYKGIPKEGPLPAEQAREAIHGYYAAMSFTDACIGRVLDGLDRLGLREKTIVVLWGDHGYFLGEHGMWTKHANYEEAVRAPLIVSAPGQKPGQKSPALVEFVDMYPTLAELAGLPAPSGVEGASLVPLLKNPQTPWKEAVFHVFPRKVEGYGKRALGRAIRTKDYRLVEWAIPETDFLQYELYDLARDPAENVNLANDPASAATVAELKKRLDLGWRAALPSAATQP